MKILDVGCGTDKVKGAIGIDRTALPGVDIVHDLNKYPWPIEDESYDEIYMLDIIEHLNDTIKTMEEAHRILKKNGKLYIRVVYWNHIYSYSDPTHVKFFSEITFDFFTGKRREYYTKARFKIDKFEYTYDSRAKKLFKSTRIMRFLSYFLCNMIDGMRITLVKK